MTNQITPWDHSGAFSPGTTIRSAPMNAKFDGISSNLEAIAQFANTKAISFRIPPTKSVIEALTLNSLLYVNPLGELTLYPKSAFDSDVQTAVTASNTAGIFAGQAEDSADRARQSELNAAASAELAQGAAVSVAGAAFFAGNWNAATGNFPVAPTGGSSIWRASANGAGATSDYKQGDFIMWDIISSVYRRIPGMERVQSLELEVANNNSNLLARVNTAQTLAVAGL